MPLPLSRLAASPLDFALARAILPRALVLQHEPSRRLFDHPFNRSFVRCSIVRLLIGSSDQSFVQSLVRSLLFRNSQMLNIPLFRSATGQKTFQYRKVNIWNNLNNNIKF